MPKIDIDYSNTIIYKISCKDSAITDLYIGHTTNFVQRKHNHKQSCINKKTNNYNCKLYEVIRANGGWANWKMEIIYFFDCKNHYEARKKEQEYFESLHATLNSIEPFPKPNTKPHPKLLVHKIIKETLHCKLCDVNLNNRTALEQHNATKKHKKKMEVTLTIVAENTNTISDFKYTCKNCNFHTNNKKDYNKHLITEKHKKLLLIFEEQQKIEKKGNFLCKYCDYNCSKNSEYIKHLLTNKHINNASGNSNILKTEFKCKKCDKKYLSRKGLWGHNKTCESMIKTETEEQPTVQDKPSEEFIIISNMVTVLLKNNTELQQQMAELIKQKNTL
jgi:hypothetical protein